MKKPFSIILIGSILFVTAIVAIQQPGRVSAIVIPSTLTPSMVPTLTPTTVPTMTPTTMPTPTFFWPTETPLPTVIPTQVIPGIAAGQWNTTTEVDVDLTANPAPSWLQLMSRGVTITSAKKICHPFRGGQFSWVGEIRQLVDGQWLKLETTTGKLDGPEGMYSACANAPAAGTYALFGYYTGPNEPAPGYTVCYFKHIGWGEDYGIIGNSYSERWLKIGFDMKVDLPLGTVVRYSIYSVDPEGSIDANLTGSTTVTYSGTTAVSNTGYISASNQSDIGSRKVAFFPQEIHFTSDYYPSFWVRLEYPTLKCYENLQFLGKHPR